MKIHKGTISRDFMKSPLVGMQPERCSFEIRVEFPALFSVVPYVQISIEKMDTGSFIEESRFTQRGRCIHHTVMRYDASVCDVSESGFTLRVSTWSSSVIYGFRISWMAMGEDERRFTIKELLREYADAKPAHEYNE